ncbi:hypothetical protein Bca4012_049874 [Brassica carinata]
MEFSETFGCVWSSKEVVKMIIGRAEHWERLLGATPASRSDLPYQTTLPERSREVARIFIARRHENGPGATSRSDPSRIVSKLKVDSLIDRLPSLVRNLITQDLIPMPMSSLFP